MIIILDKFQPLAPLVWVQNEVTDGHVMSPHFLMSNNEISKLPTSLCSRGITHFEPKEIEWTNGGNEWVTGFRGVREWLDAWLSVGG